MKSVSAVIHATGVDLDGPAPARSGRWKAWVFGRPEGWERLTTAHRLGEPGSHTASQVLAAMADRVGADRAMAQFEGHWHGILAEGSDTFAVSSRLGTGAWWWKKTPAGVAIADHPRALPELGGAAAAALAKILGGQQLSGTSTVWPSVHRVQAGALLTVHAGEPAEARSWWNPGSPPEGRAGNRAVWDRAVHQAMVLGIGRATRSPGWLHFDGGTAADRELVRRAAIAPAETPAPGPVEAVLNRVPRLAEPVLSTAARRVAGAVVGSATDLRPGVVAVGAGRLVGEGWSRTADPSDWTHNLVHALPRSLVGPLQNLRGGGLVIPALAHPALVEVAARVPWRHLRGLRGTMAKRLDLVSAAADPWTDWLDGPGESRLADAARVLADLGPLPQDDAGRARAVVLAAWRS